MPQISKNLVNDADLVNNENVPFRARLIELFKAQDFVLVKNIDDEDFQWQYMPTTGEETLEDGESRLVLGRRSFNGDYSRMNVGNEEFWQIDAGQTEVLLGENAYVFIEGLYKRVVAKRMTERFKGDDYYDPKNPGKLAKRARNFNWGTDVGMQNSIIDEIFLGVQTPQFGGNKANVATGPATTAK